MKRYLAGVVTGLAIAGLLVWIVSDGRSAHGDVGATGYSVEDIYRYIASNGATNPAEGDHPISPPGPPGSGAMHTLRDVMLSVKEKLPCRVTGLPSTGQTKCYDETGSEIDCSSADYPGQDGFYQAGCPTAGRFTDNGDGTVLDNCTGLMWQKDTADVSGNGTIGGEDQVSWKHALQYCEGLSFAGHTDWRLPNGRELQSIAEYRRSIPSIDPIFIAASGMSSYYWSSSTCEYDPVYAWYVHFYYGNADCGWKSNANYVRAVRSGP
jgi:hypothetical protein